MGGLRSRMSARRSSSVVLPALAIMIFVGIVVVAGGDDVDAPTTRARTVTTANTFSPAPVSAAPGSASTTFAPVPTLDPRTTIPAEEAGVRVEADGCSVTVQADAEGAGTAVVRMSGSVVDRTDRMAIADGMAEVGIRLTPQVVGAYRFDVTVTGDSSAVSASVTEDIDCRP